MLSSSPQSPVERIRQLMRESAVLRPRDLDAEGIPREYLRRLHDRGLVERVSRGLYVLADAEYTDQHSLVEASARVPKAVVCLLSALRFHDLTTQNRFEVWLAIGPSDWFPRVTYPPLRIVRFSGEARQAGVEVHSIEGRLVRIYNPAKTVADCFKYRNKIGLDVALEALREAWRDHRASMDELWQYAQVCRVASVMRPYLESLG